LDRSGVRDHEAIPGILILVGARIFSRARGGRRALLGTGEA
jgi:hypothetical protein